MSIVSLFLLFILLMAFTGSPFASVFNSRPAPSCETLPGSGPHYLRIYCALVSSLPSHSSFRNSAHVCILLWLSPGAPLQCALRLPLSLTNDLLTSYFHQFPILLKTSLFVIEGWGKERLWLKWCYINILNYDLFASGLHNRHNAQNSQKQSGQCVPSDCHSFMKLSQRVNIIDPINSWIFNIVLIQVKAIFDVSSSNASNQILTN